ncbi:ferritin-like domain-containing protein [Kitasatospora sp. NA04385]|uniref:ferritin-like domain-containing protein n=1 Tax=Kitasatospora sp. NA04385 TaxID=2742135 RepID=UPI0015924CAB|nr:ferritin-like domain-containing protein [Kitasatospora sp. NA04385]QKW22531.1 ferritin-like domain-containing protein [Kitasatospora sp. NA04385]
MPGSGFGEWVAEFEAERARRERTADPRWERGAELPATVARSLQKFQVGESGDGANLRTKADQAGDGAYAAAVRLFVDEERNHGRLLAELLGAAGVPLLDGHWSDGIFVRVRRLLGLRTELMMLMVAELIAVEYYRSVRDGLPDPLTREVTDRILRDERRHIPFHVLRLQQSFEELPPPARPFAHLAWLLLALAGALFVAVDHGPALHAVRASRTRFLLAVTRHAWAVGTRMAARDGRAAADPLAG